MGTRWRGKHSSKQCRHPVTAKNTGRRRSRRRNGKLKGPMQNPAKERRLAMGLYEDIDDPNSKYYFNLETNTVEKGLVSDWTHRMGPYETEEVARAALEKARERNQKWDEDDEKWNG